MLDWSVGALELFRADLALHGALLLLGAGALAALRGRPKLGALALCMLSAGAVMWVALELAATNFFLVTGSSLDLALIEYALLPETDLWGLVRSSTPKRFFVLGGLGALWLLVAPQVVRWRLSRRAAAPAARWPSSRWPLAAALLVCALLPPLVEQRPGVASNAVLYILGSGIDRLREDSADGSFAHLARSISSRGGKRKNIVVIVLESVRASATTIHDPALTTTPYMAALARRSLWADRAYVVVPHSSKANVAILCGVEPNLLLSITESTPSGLLTRCMARLLGAHGYRTAIFENAYSSFERWDVLAKNMGYQHFVDEKGLPNDGFERANYFGFEDDIMIEPTREWVRENKTKPFHLTYVTVTPHHEYLAPKRYGHVKYSGNEVFNRYLNSVRYMDFFVKNVVDMLKEQGVWEETILVIVGDHGEGFGEHGMHQHDNIPYEEVLRVPLLIHDPSDPRERRIDVPASQIDIMPTALGMAGWSLDGPTRGADLREAPTARPIYASCWLERSCLIQIDGHLKSIHYFDKRRDEAFNLLVDKGEGMNIAPGRSDMSRRVAAMVAWRRVVRGAYDKYYSEFLSDIVFDEEPQTISNKIRFDMGEYLEFLGYDLEGGARHSARSEVTMTFYYKVKRRIPEGWQLSTQAVTDRGVWLNLDHGPAQGLHPMHKWEPGTYIKDVYTYKLPGILRRGGKLTVEQGLYLSAKGQITHAPVTGQPASAQHKVRLFTLEIVDSAPSTPQGAP